MKTIIANAKRPARLLAVTAAAALTLSACAQPQRTYTINTPQIDPNARSTQGAVIGALAGAAIGATRGDDGNDRRQNALTGAIIGGAAGTGVGVLLDRQAQQLQQDLAGSGVTVARTNNSITLNLPGDITFASNSAVVSPQFQPSVDRIAQTLQQYPNTQVQIIGHTDSTGSYQLNQTLSENRARAVAAQLAARGVAFGRVSTAGANSTSPIADNATEYGRSQNRRVDIVITPSRV